MRTQRVTAAQLEELAYDTGAEIERDVDAGILACRISGVDFYAAMVDPQPEAML